jgi:hypothetical protein
LSFPEKQELVYRGLNRLLHASPKNIGAVRPNTERSLTYLTEIGLEVVYPRSKVGFGTPQQQSTKYVYPIDTVVKIGSFIDYTRKLATMEASERPAGINPAKIRYFMALADHLEKQIAAAEATD